MAWTWLYDKPSVDPSAASEALLRSEEFPTQGDAESWIGESWRELAADGVRAVTLYEDERAVYGPMSLSPTG